jgi:hypothetical protein
MKTYNALFPFVRCRKLPPVMSLAHWGIFSGVFLVASMAYALDPLPAETYMLDLIEAHEGQLRSEFVRNDVLLFAARKKAEDMAAREYFSHQDPDGFGMNFTISMAGYGHNYSKARSANNIESIGARHQNGLSGQVAADIVFNAWMESPGHRTHVLGTQDFFAKQTYVAVGYAFDPQGPHGWSSHYFSFLSAPPDEDAALSPVSEWLFSTLTLPQMENGDPDEDGIGNLLEYALKTDPLSKSTAPKLRTRYLPETHSLQLDYPLNGNLHPSLKWAVYSTVWIDFPFWNQESTFDMGTPMIFPVDRIPAKYFKIDLIRETDPEKNPF